MDGRYQLVVPFIDNNIYSAKNPIAAAKICYNQIKSKGTTGLTSFTIKNIDTKESFSFKINNPSVSGEAVDKSYVQIDELKKRIKVMETKLQPFDLTNPMFAYNIGYLKTNKLEDSSCSIL